MDAFETQIRSLIAAGHSTVAIAEALEIDIGLVRAVAGTANDGDRADMMGVLKSIALDRGARNSDRIKAAIYVHSEALGRNDKLAGAMFSVTPVIELATRLSGLRDRALPRRTYDLQALDAAPALQPEPAGENV